MRWRSNRADCAGDHGHVAVPVLILPLLVAVADRVSAQEGEEREEQKTVDGESFARHSLQGRWTTRKTR